MRRLTLIAAGLLLLIPLQASASRSFVEQFDVPSDANYVGAKLCLDCHDDVGEFYAHSPHSPEVARAVPWTGSYGCESCHGPGSDHVENEGDGFILGPDVLGSLDENQSNAMCQQCHTTQDQGWGAGPHAGSGITCSDCHADQVHFGGKALPAKEFRNQTEFCIQCHAGQVTDFRLPFRHRVLEGEMACNDCHDPHTGFDDAGWNGLNDTCTNCHTEMSGPYVFEHEGVADEECITCHKAHGSIHDKLLTQDGNTLCLQCHYEGGLVIGGQAHSGLLGSEARCYDCHTEIHGSNVSSTFEN